VIPQKFHRIWFGTRERPKRYDMYWKRLQEYHPHAEFHTWTEDNLFPLINQKAYDELSGIARGGVPMTHERTVAVQRADVVGYECVYQHGGVYLNCDVLPLKSFKPLLEHKAFLGMEDNYHVCNAVMGGEAGHPLYRDVINGLQLNLDRFWSNGMEVATGPQYLTKVWRTGQYDVEVLPQDAFYSTHHGDLPWGGGINHGEIVAKGQEKNAYAVHMWGHRTQEGKFNQ
jgi:mannosyltransferase OCH1-like enzyme